MIRQNKYKIIGIDRDKFFEYLKNSICVDYNDIGRDIDSGMFDHDKQTDDVITPHMFYRYARIEGCV
jgi:hypothetical protein